MDCYCKENNDHMVSIISKFSTRNNWFHTKSIYITDLDSNHSVFLGIGYMFLVVLSNFVTQYWLLK